MEKKKIKNKTFYDRRPMMMPMDAHMRLQESNSTLKIHYSMKIDVKSHQFPRKSSALETTYSLKTSPFHEKFIRDNINFSFVLLTLCCVEDELCFLRVFKI